MKKLKPLIEEAESAKFDKKNSVSFLPDVMSLFVLKKKS